MAIAVTFHAAEVKAFKMWSGLIKRYSPFITTPSTKTLQGCTKKVKGRSCDIKQNLCYLSLSVYPALNSS